MYISAEQMINVVNAMELKEKSVNNCMIISVSGDVVLSSEINRLERRICSVFRKHKQIILDLSELNLIGSQGIQMLLEVWQDIYCSNGLLILACLQSAARIAFSINKAYAFIETGTVAEALEKIKC